MRKDFRYNPDAVDYGALQAQAIAEIDVMIQSFGDKFRRNFRRKDRQGK
ncbi:hypothetical protein [Clostridium vitabionis]|jgi:hypothetical protein|nr:hypothetical protein [Clostridium vitabionis]